MNTYVTHTYFLAQEFGDKRRIAQYGQNFYKIAFKTPELLI